MAKTQTTMERQQTEYQKKKELLSAVEILEIKARKWKAEFEIMDYHLKVEALTEEYQRLMETKRTEIEEYLAKGMEAGQIKPVEEEQANG